VDVRKVPARVLAVAGDPGDDEIGVRPNESGRSVHVSVPAFAMAQAGMGLPRLQVRLLDG
jgi:hypothetical protein